MTTQRGTGSFRESGAAVLFALGFILLAAGLTSAVWSYSNSQLSTATQIRQATQLENALEAGVQAALRTYNRTGESTAADQTLPLPGGITVKWTAGDARSSDGGVPITITANQGDKTTTGSAVLVPITTASVAVDDTTTDPYERPVDAATTALASVIRVMDQNLWATQNISLTGTATTYDPATSDKAVGSVATEGSIAISSEDPGSRILLLGPKTYTIAASDRCINLDASSDPCSERARVDTITLTLGTNTGTSGRQVNTDFLNRVRDAATSTTDGNGDPECDYTWSASFSDFLWLRGRVPGAKGESGEARLTGGVYCLGENFTVGSWKRDGGVARILAPVNGTAVFVPISESTSVNFTLGSNVLFGVTATNCSKPTSSTGLDPCATEGARRVLFAGIDNFSAPNHNNFVAATIFAKDGCFLGNATKRPSDLVEPGDELEVSFVGSAVCSWIRVDGSTVLPDSVRKANQERARGWFPTVWTATERIFSPPTS